MIAEVELKLHSISDILRSLDTLLLMLDLAHGETDRLFIEDPGTNNIYTTQDGFYHILSQQGVWVSLDTQPKNRLASQQIKLPCQSKGRMLGRYQHIFFAHGVGGVGFTSDTKQAKYLWEINSLHLAQLGFASLCF